MYNNKISALLTTSLSTLPLMFPADTSSAVSQIQVESSSSLPRSTSQRASFRRMQYQLLTAPRAQPMGTHVGELQEKWQFPSDHLPIGMTFENLNFVSWNVLDAKYMNWVTEKNSQGLSRSMIADEHIYLENSMLTIRDKHVANLILETILHPTHPKAILSLQECSEPFIEELRSQLPSHFEILLSHGEAFLINRQLFEVVSHKTVSGIFSNESYRTVQDVTIRRLDNGQLLRLVNAHLPGDPTKPGRFEFAGYLAETFDPNLTTLAMGDMNFDELEMADAMQQAFHNSSPFSLCSPYCTNISPVLFNSKAIDHFFIYSPNTSSVVASRPDEIMAGLSDTVALLQPLENR